MLPTELALWLKENSVWLSWLGGLSLLTMLLSAVLVPVFIVRMQPDYFLDDRDVAQSFGNQHPSLRLFAKILKNLIGGILLVGGILMLVLPGQGLLTILIGLAVMDFPGKRKAELWLIRRKPIYWAIAKMREKADRPPLILPSINATSEKERCVTS